MFLTRHLIFQKKIMAAKINLFSVFSARVQIYATISYDL